MSNTIEDFLNYFKPNKQKENFDITDNIKKVLNLINVSLENKQIKLYFNTKENLEAYGLADEFVQVILAIINNAIQAMEDKKNKKLNIEVFKQDDKIIIEVSDSGGGIPKKIKEKIFEPYFTTKHQSQGTGLGLYISKMIIENSMNGELKVMNTKYGAKFTIVLRGQK